ncbi:hypothetical protein [Burkholderia multivorans]|uniref:hypothetical protein n=1 Tax=Burkholderia multivorans TaxID=87883 RepID=UPI002018984A|nr:hypothetical protein [Burkholderia multivorans]MCO1361318.1 hypothetical protein [Burkholderia multivorans]MCO1421088.1 hypothetical protein [Burkholderia multivorans]MDR9053459.1 hypothetical protein [Burkholderia multivorans]MDR9060231.1 hypothetical protein [Burkholderia multivorans]MDR9066485.1 hypothetical protein [Burkholderia multivorans]
MSIQKINTPDDFKAWCLDNIKMIHAQKAKRDDAVAGALRFAARRIEIGYSVQEAGDLYMRAAKSTRTPKLQRDAARDALVAIGWKPKSERDGGAE